MIKNISIGAKNAVRAYLGESLVWQAAPKLSANFTTGTYKANGATKTFADLFTFSRAGKAWLVKDTGLQEYVADVPRFDNGLLIEREATNYADNVQYANDFFEYTKLKDDLLRIECKKDWSGAQFPYHNTGGQYPAGSSGYEGKYKYIGLLVHETNTTVYVESGQKRARATTITNGRLDSIDLIDNIFKYQFYFGISRPPIDEQYIAKVGDYCIVSGLNYSINDDTVLPLTLIKTSGVAVTRPSDFLLNKITGTTLTGDWDSTLTLSIVNGQIVHSGYGRIRSLEIN